MEAKARWRSLAVSPGPVIIVSDGRGVTPMTREELLQRISINPNTCFGKPCIRGHRIWVSLILDLLAAGTSIEEILDQYPGVTREDVLACIAYGSEMSRERYVDIPVAKPA
jgi:uncharacterized protein (DUF433 family)